VILELSTESNVQCVRKSLQASVVFPAKKPCTWFDRLNVVVLFIYCGGCGNKRSQQTGMKEVLCVSIRGCTHATLAVAIHYAFHTFSLGTARTSVG